MRVRIFSRVHGMAGAGRRCWYMIIAGGLGSLASSEQIGGSEYISGHCIMRAIEKPILARDLLPNLLDSSHTFLLWDKRQHPYVWMKNLRPYCKYLEMQPGSLPVAYWSLVSVSVVTHEGRIHHTVSRWTDGEWLMVLQLARAT